MSAFPQQMVIGVGNGRTLMEAFLADAAERMAALLDARVVLETDHADREAWDKVRRAGHTIAGNAAMMGFDAVAHVARAVERRAAALAQEVRGEFADVLVLDGERLSLERLVAALAAEMPGRGATIGERAL